MARSASGPATASAAATNASISNPRRVARNSTATRATAAFADQGQVDQVSRHGTEHRDDNQEVRQRQEVAGPSQDTLSGSSTTSQGGDLQSKLEHVQAKLKKLSAHARRQQDHIAELEEKLGRREDRIIRREDTILRLKEDTNVDRHNQNIILTNHRAALEGKDQIISALKGKFDAATADNEVLLANLEDCKERIFRLQPFEAKSDTEIASLYEGLCETVTALVAELFDRGDDVGAIANGTAAITAKFVLEYGRSSGYSDKMAGILKKNPLADEVMLSSVIFQYLSRQILSGGGLCLGLDRGTEEFVYGIMNELCQLEPAKDPESIQMWRVDTFRALSAMQHVTEEQSALKEEYVSVLLRCIEAVAPGAADKACQQACQKAVEAAAILAHEMRLATAGYFESTVNDSEPQLYGRELQEHKLMDAETGQMLKRSAIKEHKDGTIIGQTLCNVFPALTRKTAKDEKQLVVAKETILVQIHDDFRQKKPKRTEGGASLLKN